MDAQASGLLCSLPEALGDLRRADVPVVPRFTPGGGAQRPPISGRESPPHAERLTLALFVQTSS